MAGPAGRAPRGARPKVENPGQVMKRLMSYVFKDYKIHCLFVFIFIFVGVIANVQGTMFTKTLIDDYILPLIGKQNSDFSNLAKAIGRVACFYGLGIVANFM